MTISFKKKFILLFLMIPFFPPQSIQYISALSPVDMLYNAWKLAAIAVLYFLFIYLAVTQKTLSKIVLAVIAFEGMLYFSTILNSGDTLKALTNFLLVTGFTILVDLGIKFEFQLFLTFLTRILAVLILLNFVLLFIFPNGLVFATLYDNWVNPLHFITIDNGMAPFLIVFMACAFAEYYYFGKKPDMKLYLMIAVCLVTAVKIASASAIATTFIFAVLMLSDNRMSGKLMNVRLMISAYVAIFTTIIVVQNVTWLSPIVETLLGRSLTFTGRSFLWTKAMDLFAANPIFGYGYPLSGGHIPIWDGYYSAHNFILEILLNGGIFAIGLFLIICYLAFSRLNQMKMDDLPLTIFISLYCYLLLFLVEAYSSGMTFFGMMVIAYNIPQIVLSKNAVESPPENKVPEREGQRIPETGLPKTVH